MVTPHSIEPLSNSDLQTTESSQGDPPQLNPPASGFAPVPAITVLEAEILEAEIKALKAREAALQEINGDLERQIIHQAQVMNAMQQDLKQQKYLFQLLVEQSPDVIIRFDRQLSCTYVNPVVFNEYGVTPDAMIGKQLLEFTIPPLERDLWCQQLQRVFVQKNQACFEFSNQHPSALQSYQVRLLPELDEMGKVGSVLAIIHNVTAFKSKENQLFQALHEKEIFLQEVHHRIKNNLQMVSSLLNLQSSSIEDSSTIGPFADAQARIQAMALIHEQLYQSSQVRHINFREYAEQLATNLFRSYCQDDHRLTLDLNLESVHLTVDQAIPCGLIMNELMTNAFKYAFPNQVSGTIRCTFQQSPEQICRLMIGDDGIGLPTSVDIHRTDSLGFQLVTALTAKLRGTLEVERRGGSQFVIQFRKA